MGIECVSGVVMGEAFLEWFSCGKLKIIETRSLSSRYDALYPYLLHPPLSIALRLRLLLLETLR